MNDFIAHTMNVAAKDEITLVARALRNPIKLLFLKPISDIFTILPTPILSMPG